MHQKGGLAGTKFWLTCTACLLSAALSAAAEWTVTYAGFKDENGVLPRDAIRKQFNGSLFYEYAARVNKSMKEKKGHGKHLQ